MKFIDTEDSGQQVTLTFSYTQKSFKVTVVCDRCSCVERLDLWETIQGVADNTHIFWIIGEDFNVILT